MTKNSGNDDPNDESPAHHDRIDPPTDGERQPFDLGDGEDVDEHAPEHLGSAAQRDPDDALDGGAPAEPLHDDDPDQADDESDNAARNGSGGNGSGGPAVPGGQPPRGGTGDGSRLDVHDPNPSRQWRQDANEAVHDAIQPLRRRIMGKQAGELRSPVLIIRDRFLTGTLDLRAREFPYLLRFVRCRFQRPPDLRQASIAGCEFDRCWLPGFEGRNLRSGNDFTLRRSTVDGGRLDLTDGRVNGSLNLSGSRLSNPGEPTLHANRLVLTGALYATEATFNGEIRIPGMRVGGNVNLRGSTLNSTSGFALNANGIQISGNLLCDRHPDTGSQFSANGALLMTSARIASDLTLRGAHLRQDHPQDSLVPREDPKFDYAATLVADRVHVQGNVYLDRELYSAGTLRMVNANVGGSLWLNSSTVDPYADGDRTYVRRALHVDGTQINGDLEAVDGKLRGQLRMADVTVRGSMLLDGSEVRLPGEDVLRARRLSVGGNLDCRNSDIQGSFLLQGASVGANLDLRGTRMTEPARYKRDDSPKPSLDIRATTIGRDLICARSESAAHGGPRPFSAHGEIRMHRASVAREANFSGALLGERLGGTTLNAFGASFQDLVVTFGAQPKGRINLRHASCASLADAREFWDTHGGVDLEDFRYDSFATPIDLRDDAAVQRQLRWLRGALQQTYRPGPYDQLAAVFRASGNEEHASSVLIEKQWRRYQALADGYRVLRPGVWVWSTVQWLMVGYGYRPTRALVWLLGLLLFGSLFFGLGTDDCVQHARALNLVVRGPRCTLSVDDTGAVWNPFLYTLDLLVPIVDFGNKGRWHMAGADQWLSAFFTAMGWILATTVAAGVTRMLRRQ